MAGSGFAGSMLGLAPYPIEAVFKRIVTPGRPLDRWRCRTVESLRPDTPAGAVGSPAECYSVT
jgi:hypothetical protein